MSAFFVSKHNQKYAKLNSRVVDVRDIQGSGILKESTGSTLNKVDRW